MKLITVTTSKQLSEIGYFIPTAEPKGSVPKTAWNPAFRRAKAVTAKRRA